MPSWTIQHSFCCVFSIHPKFYFLFLCRHCYNNLKNQKCSLFPRDSLWLTLRPRQPCTGGVTSTSQSATATSAFPTANRCTIHHNNTGRAPSFCTILSPLITNHRIISGGEKARRRARLPAIPSRTVISLSNPFRWSITQKSSLPLEEIHLLCRRLSDSNYGVLSVRSW